VTSEPQAEPLAIQVAIGFLGFSKAVVSVRIVYTSSFVFHL